MDAEHARRRLVAKMMDTGITEGVAEYALDALLADPDALIAALGGREVLVFEHLDLGGGMFGPSWDGPSPLWAFSPGEAS